MSQIRSWGSDRSWETRASKRNCLDSDPALESGMKLLLEGGIKKAQEGRQANMNIDKWENIDTVITDGCLLSFLGGRFILPSSSWQTPRSWLGHLRPHPPRESSRPLPRLSASRPSLSSRAGAAPHNYHKITTVFKLLRPCRNRNKHIHEDLFVKATSSILT